MPMPVNVFTEFYSGYLPPVTGGVKQHESPAIVLFPSFLVQSMISESGKFLRKSLIGLFLSFNSS